VKPDKILPINVDYPFGLAPGQAESQPLVFPQVSIADNCRSLEVECR